MLWNTDRVTLEDVAERTVEAFWSLGGRQQMLDGGMLVRHEAAPAHPLGNFMCRLRTRTCDDLDALLLTARTFPPIRRVLIDRATPSVVEAHLVARDWTLEHQLQLVLPADVEAPAADETHGPALDDSDWTAIEELFRLDHLEEDRRLGRPARGQEETAAAVRLRRSLGGTVEYLLARRAGAVIGCTAVWVSDEGVGLIEDVFVHPDYRGQGIATGLLRDAVQRARGRGAGPIVIGAEPDDTPKHLYVGFGFRPTRVATSMVAGAPER